MCVTSFFSTSLSFSCFCHVQELRKYKENEKDTEVLMSALSAMQEKTQHLENSLSAETRIKLDLFSALGDAKRQLEIAQGSRRLCGYDCLIHAPHGHSHKKVCYMHFLIQSLSNANKLLLIRINVWMLT